MLVYPFEPSIGQNRGVQRSILLVCRGLFVSLVGTVGAIAFLAPHSLPWTIPGQCTVRLLEQTFLLLFVAFLSVYQKIVDAWKMCSVQRRRGPFFLLFLSLLFFSSQLRLSISPSVAPSYCCFQSIAMPTPCCLVTVDATTGHSRKVGIPPQVLWRR